MRLELTWDCSHRLLKPACLPFHHLGSDCKSSSEDSQKRADSKQKEQRSKFCRFYEHEVIIDLIYFLSIKYRITLRMNSPQEDLFPIPERTTCPKCTCGFARLAEEDPLGKKNPILQLSRTHEKKDLLQQVENIRDFADFEQVRESVKQRYRITFLVMGDGGIRLDQIPGMCKRTQENFKRAMSVALRQSHETHAGGPKDALLGVLQRHDNLFSDHGLE